MEKKRCDMVLDAPNCQFPLLLQVALIGAQMLRAKLLGRLAKVLGEPHHETQVAADGGVGVVAALNSFSMILRRCVIRNSL
jgi:hypothetical protein